MLLREEESTHQLLQLERRRPGHARERHRLIRCLSTECATPKLPGSVPELALTNKISFLNLAQDTSERPNKRKSKSRQDMYIGLSTSGAPQDKRPGLPIALCSPLASVSVCVRGREDSVTMFDQRLLASIAGESDFLRMTSSVSWIH